MIEMGEMVYTEVDESTLDEALRDNISFDDAVEIVKNGGDYISGSYDITVCTPNEDIYETRDHEIYVDAEDAFELVLDEINSLQTQKANVYRLLEEAKREIHALKYPTKQDEISIETKVLVGDYLDENAPINIGIYT